MQGNKKKLYFVVKLRSFQISHSQFSYHQMQFEENITMATCPDLG